MYCSVEFRVTDDQRRTKPYREEIVSRMYVMVGKRCDLVYAVCKLSKYNYNPGQIHCNAVKRVIIYIILSKKVRFCY